MPTRWLQRLADEFDDDGIELPADPEFCRLLLEELDHCRRAPMFEGRRPTYGAIIPRIPEPFLSTKQDSTRSTTTSSRSTTIRLLVVSTPTAGPRFSCGLSAAASRSHASPVRC